MNEMNAREIISLIGQDIDLDKRIVDLLDNAFKNDSAFKEAVVAVVDAMDEHIAKIWDDRGADDCYGPDDQLWQEDIQF